MVDNCMGPNPLWLLEDLLRDVEVAPGMRVLDLGCGRGMTSIFLAREFGVEVVAADYWVGASENQQRFDDAGISAHVLAVNAEAHALPFRDGDFDAIISVDAYHYFGTNDLYVGYISRFLKSGGQLAIAVPSLHRELRELGRVPEHLRIGIGWEILSFHAPEWWRFEWEQSEVIEVTTARSQSDGWLDWRLWCEVCAEHAASETVRQGSRDCLPMLEADRGDLLTFALITGRKTTSGTG